MNIKLLIAICMCFCMTILNTNAQEDNYDINGFSAGVTPSALLNLWTGYQAKVGYGFADHYEITLNAGFLYGKRQDVSYEGYRFKPSVKYYFINDYEVNRFFIEIGYLRRVTDEEYIDTYDMFGGTFQKDIINNRERVVNGGYIMYGSRQAILGSKFYTEIGIGGGLGSSIITVDAIENAQPAPDESFFVTNLEGENPYLIIMLHFSIGYDF